MMKLVPLNHLFEIEYGNQFDFNKMTLDNSAVCFVSRSKNNLGIVARVRRLNNVEPYDSGNITVALGGSLLSSFIQPEPFYTAQNIKVLKPLTPMTFKQKLYYCKCISFNRFKYTSHGREANKTLDNLLVPSLEEIPEWVDDLELSAEPNKDSVIEEYYDLDDRVWSWFYYRDLFVIDRGKGARKKEIDENAKTPLITSIDSNNGLVGYVNSPPAHQGNVITVNRNGSVGQAFYQPEPFCSTEDVHVFIPKFTLNPFIAMFLVPLIMKEKYRYSYGRKWGIERMKNTRIKLPVDEKGQPDWEFMGKYVQGLPFSSNLI